METLWFLHGICRACETLQVGTIAGRVLVTAVPCMCSQVGQAAGTAARQVPAPDARQQLMSAIRGGQYRLKSVSAVARGKQAVSNSKEPEALPSRPLSGLHALIRQRTAALCGGSSVSGSSGTGWGD